MRKLEWSSETKFIVSGGVVEIMINQLRQELEKPECQQILRMAKCLDELESLVSNGIEEGKVQITE